MRYQQQESFHIHPIRLGLPLLLRSSRSASLFPARTENVTLFKWYSYVDVQKVQVHDLGTSGFIPNLGSKYRWHWPKGFQLWGGEREDSFNEVSIIITHNMKVYLECSDLNLSWFYSVNTLLMNNNSWRIRIERTCREEQENLGQLKNYSSWELPLYPML